MDEEEIDSLNYEYNTIINEGVMEDSQEARDFLEKYSKIKLPEVIVDGDIDKACKAIMMRIEDGAYDYFCQLITKDATPLIKFMQFSTKKDDIKSLIADRRRYPWLDPDDVKNLIIATQEPDYIKSCIADREILGIMSYDVKDLIIATHDTDYIKSCITDRAILGLMSYEVKDLIIATHDTDYIKSCIADREYREFFLGLMPYDVKDLIIAIQDPDYIKSCIADRENLGLMPDDVKKLIIATQDPDYIKSYIVNIEDRENLGLISYDVKDLIIAIQDPDYIKSCIADRENLELMPDEVKDLIIATQDLDYIKSCIVDRENLGLDAYDMDNLYYSVKDLIIETKNPSCIKSWIEDRENLGLNSYIVKDLIIATHDPDYIKSCIEDRENLGLDASDAVEMILLTGDIEYIAECERKLNREQIDVEKLSVFTKKVNINLPPEMTIGVEIETEGQEKDNSEAIKKFLIKTGWKAKGDGSLVNGTEVVSPILTGDSENSSNEIRRVCAVLNGVPQTISERCGGHIHIGADYLTSKQDWVNLIEIWTNAEKVLYTICNEEGSIPRNGVPQYAQPISKKIEEAMKTGTISLEGEEDLSEFASTVATIQASRYSGINFCNVGKKGKNTIEFRLPNGTINPNTWIENINLFGGIVRSAHELSIIQAKPEGQITETERKMLDNVEMLQTGENEEQIAKALIELCITPEDRHVYMDRYTTNNPLLDNSPDMKDAITRQISTSKIGKKVFTGKDAINGEDYNKGAAIIEEELARDNIMQGMEQGE